jgi:hypothetical protein
MMGDAVLRLDNAITDFERAGSNAAPFKIGYDADA